MHLFGAANRWGKLPVTVYPQLYETHIPISEMSMTAAPGRTYKYYSGKPLYPFGWGLSYTTFRLTGSCPNNPPVALLHPHRQPGVDLQTEEQQQRWPTLHCSVTVENTGPMDGDEVVQVFVVPNASSIFPPDMHTTPDPDPLALRQLVAFQRVQVGVGQSVTVPFDIELKHFASVTRSGDRVVWPGRYDVVFTNSGQVGASSEQPEVVRQAVQVQTDRTARYVLLQPFGQRPLPVY